MERLSLSPEQLALIDDYRTSQQSTFDPAPWSGSNLVPDDDLTIDNNWTARVISGQWGVITCLVPDWGDLIIPLDLIDYVTDRAGPNGETMPIFDEQQQFARAAAKAGTPNPKDAAKDERTRRRNLQQALRDGIARLPNDQQKHARQALREHGVLGKGFERIRNIDESRTDYWVTYNQGLSSTEDQYLPVEERRNRVEVIVGSHLRRGDDVLFADTVPLRVIGPGPGASTIAVYNPDLWGDELHYLALEDLSHLTDRAPLDTAEEPMPIFDDELQKQHRQGRARRQGKAYEPLEPRSHDEVLREFSAQQPPHVQLHIEALSGDKRYDAPDAYSTLHQGGTRQKPPTSSDGSAQPADKRAPENTDHLPQPGVTPDGKLHKEPTTGSKDTRDKPGKGH